MQMLCLLFSTACKRTLTVALLLAVGVLPAPALGQSAQDKLLKQVQKWVASTQNTSPERVDLAPLDARVEVQSCSLPLQMDLPFASRETVRVRCSQPPWQLYMRLQTPSPNPSPADMSPTGSRDFASRKTVVTRHLVQRGTLLDATMLEEVALPALGMDPQAVSSVQDLLYGELLRDVPAGQVLRSSDIRRAVLVKQGQLVLMSVGQNAGFQITVRVEALQDGRLGEQIPLRNPDSGRLITGKVTGVNAVRGL